MYPNNCNHEQENNDLNWVPDPLIKFNNRQLI